jgi:hypothetical protein
MDVNIHFWGLRSAAQQHFLLAKSIFVSNIHRRAAMDGRPSPLASFLLPFNSNPNCAFLASIQTISCSQNLARGKEGEKSAHDLGEISRTIMDWIVGLPA